MSSSASPHSGSLKEKDGEVRVDVLQAETQDIYSGESLDPVYHAKAKILNNAIQEIGMGKYQWCLFFVAGFGWFSDNLWPSTPGLIYTSVTREFNVLGEWMLLGQALGLLVGAVFWGVGCDVWGRRWSFNLTLLITGVFALAAGASPNYYTLCVCVALWSIGVGGNLPVDSAVFLEYVPPSHQYLLTMLSIWWAIGQLTGALVAWPLITNFSCPTTSATCLASLNKGWRYYLFTMGGLMMVMWILRFFVFNLRESPKFLMSRGRDEEAVAVVHRVAAFNGKTSNLTIEHLKEAERLFGSAQGEAAMATSVRAAAWRKTRTLDLSHVKPLFATRKLTYSTCLLIVLWALIGLAFPLYNAFVTYYLETRGSAVGQISVYTTYRNEVILSVIGVPGALMAGCLVELPILGRRGTLSIFTALTGVFILASTTARTSNSYLAWNCGYSYTSNVMYGVLYALSPEIFPTRTRGTGNAIVATANRVFGLMAPIIAMETSITTSIPIWVAGGIFVAAGFIALLLPFEPRGKASL
ncbi:major facilitator superfamily domain-containing protein [Pisolithus croceorrhizus]|nr:major facilitator superfamily domain-containing protein [Pisolithus croceorrhizus]KAI6127507.1 major facilitator superfamily domain-containing protein [Pisolithus croceorrhizus]